MKDFKNDIAISFAEEQSEYALELAKRLEEIGIKVVLVKWNSSILWVKDLLRMHMIAINEGYQYIIPVFSKEYNKTLKTWLEYRIMKRRKDFEKDCVLPIVYDGTFPRYWPNTRGYINAKDYLVDEIVVMIRGIIQFQNETNDSINDFSYSNNDSEKQEMTITMENGDTEKVEVILAFEFKDTHQEFVIYTKNEIDTDGNVTIYVSKIDRSSGEPKLLGVEDENDWKRIKEVLWQLSARDVLSDGFINQNIPSKPFFSKDGIEVL